MIEKIEFENTRGQKLTGAIHRPAGWVEGDPGVVVCHGMLSYKDSPKHVATAGMLALEGFLALRFDFAGRGDSQGDLVDLTVGGQVQDLGAAVEFVKTRGAGDVSLVGSSLGGADVVLYAGTVGGVASLAVMASVSRPGRLFEERLGDEQIALWKRQGEIPTEQGPLGWGFMVDGLGQDVLGAASRIECPALFVHGSEDETVPDSSSRDLSEAAGEASRLEIIEGADHRFSEPDHRSRAIELVVDWVERHGKRD